jgi:hypothetical protein
VAADGQLHTNFKLTSEGETVVLKKSDGTIADSVTFPAISDNQSFARTYDGSATFEILDTSTPGSSNGPAPTGYKISGYVSPNFVSTGAEAKKNFSVKIIEINKSALTDANGYFQILDVPASQTGYTLEISKSNSITRQFKNVVVTGNLTIGSLGSPVEIWAGDVEQNNVINMGDIMRIAESFNSAAGNSRFNPNNDITMDGAVNMEDVMVVAANFNKTTGNYPTITIPTP